MTIANPAFCLALWLSGVHFRGKLKQVDPVGGQKNQVSTNQNSRNRWCQIARGTVDIINLTPQISPKSPDIPSPFNLCKAKYVKICASKLIKSGFPKCKLKQQKR